MIENCLNLISFGYDPMLQFSFYALAKGMHINDFLYYQKLFAKCKGEKNGRNK